MKISILNNNIKLRSNYVRMLSNYVQGQEPEKGIREYFYYIDHQGMVRISRKCVGKLKSVVFR